MSHRNANRRPTAMELARSTLGWGGLARAWGRSGGAMIVSSYQAFGGFGGGLMRRCFTQGGPPFTCPPGSSRPPHW